MPTPPRDFYEIQSRQRRRSLPLFAAVLAFHFVLIGTIGLALLATFGLVAGAGLLASPGFWPRFLLADLGIALVAAFLHFQDARRNGPRVILRRLQALETAIKHFKEYLAVKPDDESAAKFLVTTYMNSRRYDDAIEYFKALIKAAGGK